MKRIAFALALILAAFTFAAPTAHAQSIGFHFGRGGIHIDVGGSHSQCYPYSSGYGSYGGYSGYSSRSYYDSNRSQGYYNTRPSAIRVLVNQEVVVYDRVYDRHCGRYVNVPRRAYQQTYVTAYWDSSRGGYWYRDAYGRYCRAG